LHALKVTIQCKERRSHFQTLTALYRMTGVGVLSKCKAGGTAMVIGERLRILRTDKNFSQGEVEKRTGLLRNYISRVENGHTVPAIETLEKMSRALEVPLYQLFYDDEESPKHPIVIGRKRPGVVVWGSGGEDARVLSKFRTLLGRIKAKDRKLLLLLALRMAKSRNRPKSVAS
jgi:transcriptional regulator with XRE-family HTH domain